MKHSKIEIRNTTFPDGDFKLEVYEDWAERKGGGQMMPGMGTYFCPQDVPLAEGVRRLKEKMISDRLAQVKRVLEEIDQIQKLYLAENQIPDYHHR